MQLFKNGLPVANITLTYLYSQDASIRFDNGVLPKEKQFFEVVILEKSTIIDDVGYYSVKQENLLVDGFKVEVINKNHIIMSKTT